MKFQIADVMFTKQKVKGITEEIVIPDHVEPWEYVGRLLTGIYQSCKLCTLNSQ